MFCLRLTVTYGHMISPFVQQTSPGVFPANHVIAGIMWYKHLITTPPMRKITEGGWTIYKGDTSFNISINIPIGEIKNKTISETLYLTYLTYLNG